MRPIVSVRCVPPLYTFYRRLSIFARTIVNHPVTLNLSVGPRFPSRLQEVAWTAAEVPQCANDGFDSHRHPPCSERHPQPAEYDSTAGVRAPSQALSDLSMSPVLISFNNHLTFTNTYFPSIIHVFSGLPWVSTEQTLNTLCCPRNPKRLMRTASAGSRSTTHVNNSQGLFLIPVIFRMLL